MSRPLALLAVISLASTSASQDYSTVVKPEVVGAKVADAIQIRKRLGLSPNYDSLTSLAHVKIAVLDFGFEGYDPARKQLPPSAVVVEHYSDEFVKANNLGDVEFKKSFQPGNIHGRTMAQIVWATTNFAHDGPKFYLLNANGPTMFRRAVRFAVQEQVDVILFCNTFEGLGNFDGKGPINAVVDEAVRAGIIWINASGNFGKRTYSGPVKIGAGGFLTFADGRDFLRIRNNLDENTLTVTLNWNSYSDTEDSGTTKDLDLCIQDPNGNTIGKSDAVQIPGGESSLENQSKNPRERVVLPDLPASRGRDYLIRIKAMSRNFEDGDRIRVLVTALKDAPFNDPVTRLETSPVEFVDASGFGEIYPPADHPRVITVGDASAGASVGPTVDFRVKPDFLIEESQAVFTNGESSYGSSNAAAYFAGVVCLLKAIEPNLTTSHLLKFATTKSNLIPTAATRSPTLTRKLVIGKDGKTTSMYQPTSSTAISLQRARSTTVGDVIRALERYDPQMLAWQALDGGLTVAINRSPADMISLFPRFPQDRARVADDYDFFLAADKSTGTLKFIDYFRRKNANEPPPWKAVGGKIADWVEVRKISTSGSSVSNRLQSLLANRVWKTPTMVDLRMVVGAAKTASLKDASKGVPPAPMPGREDERSASRRG